MQAFWWQKRKEMHAGKKYFSKVKLQYCNNMMNPYNNKQGKTLDSSYCATKTGAQLQSWQMKNKAAFFFFLIKKQKLHHTWKINTYHTCNLDAKNNFIVNLLFLYVGVIQH